MASVMNSFYQTPPDQAGRPGEQCTLDALLAMLMGSSSSSSASNACPVPVAPSPPPIQSVPLLRQAIEGPYLSGSNSNALACPLPPHPIVNASTSTQGLQLPPPSSSATPGVGQISDLIINDLSTTLQGYAAPMVPGTTAILLPSGSWLCSLCGVACVDTTSMVGHGNGRAHVRKLRYYRKHSVMLTGLPSPVPLVDLQNFFSGLEVDPAIQLRSESDQSQYVTFRTERDVSRALALNGRPLWGFPITISIAEPHWDCAFCDLEFNSRWQWQHHHSSEKHLTRMMHCARCAVHLPNLPDWVNTEDLIQLFGTEYPVSIKGKAHFLVRQEESHHNDGYTIFASPSVAQRAREAIQSGRLLLRGAIPISALAVESFPAACLGVDVQNSVGVSD